MIKMVKMIDVQKGLGLKNISHLVRKQLQGIMRLNILRRNKTENI